jgi:hypothetical protein
MAAGSSCRSFLQQLRARGTQIEERAFGTTRHERLADLPSMPDQTHMKAVTDVGRNGRGELAMGDLRSGRGTDEPQSSGDAMDMGIDRKRRAAERKKQNTRRGLGPHTGQRTKIGIGVLVAEVVQTLQRRDALARLDLAQDVLDTAGLDVGDPALTDRVGNCAGGGAEDLVPRGKARLEAGEGASRVRVRCRLREDREDELVERGPAGLGPKLSVSLLQPAIESPDAAARGF